jgi:hypothetical protein
MPGYWAGCRRDPLSPCQSRWYCSFQHSGNAVSPVLCPHRGIVGGIFFQPAHGNRPRFQSRPLRGVLGQIRNGDLLARGPSRGPSAAGLPDRPEVGDFFLRSWSRRLKPPIGRPRYKKNPLSPLGETKSAGFPWGLSVRSGETGLFSGGFAGRFGGGTGRAYGRHHGRFCGVSNYAIVGGGRSSSEKCQVPTNRRKRRA